jgi:antitoxin HicB
MLKYPVILIPDAETQSLVVEFPDLPFCHSVGDDEAEALLNARDAIECALEIYFDEKRPVPLPSAAVPGQQAVHLPALITAKVLLWNEMQAQGVRKAELAMRLGCQMPQVERLLDLRHSSKIEQLEAALARLGKRLDVGLAA